LLEIVFRVHVMPVHGATLVSPRDHRLFGIEYAGSSREVSGIAVANRKKEKPFIVKSAQAEIGNVPAQI
jgi:hypothetical protein